MHAVTQLFVIPSVIRHRDPGPADDYGDHPLATVTETAERCYLAQNSRGEDDYVERERWSYFVRPDAAIDANDEVVVAGARYEVIGSPWRVIDPVTARATHIEALLERRR